jgi:hypothetical protein
MRIFLVVGALFLVACGEDEGLRVNGTAALELDGSQSGFFFEETTLLVQGDPQPGDGRIGGTCALPSDGGLAQVRLVRSGNPGEGIAVSEITLEVGSSGSHVDVTTADGIFSGEAGVEECTIEESYRDLAEGILGFTAACNVRDQNARQARFTADLHFADCSKRE